MTFDPSAPDMPPAANAAPADTYIAPIPSRGSRMRLQLEAALLNRRLLSVVLFLVLSGLVARTLLFARETPSRRALSELYQNSYEALSATKSAYVPALIFTLPAPKPVIVPPPATPRSRRTAVPLFGKSLVPTTLAKARGEQAVQKWRDTVASKQAKAAEWRRMGIVLALFHRPGVLDALAHVGDKFAPPVSTARPTRASIEAANSNVDPFGHGRTGVSVPQELAAWRLLYGTERVTPKQVPGLRTTLKQLRLGWFEDVALAQLYQKAGLHADAARIAEEADRTARSVRALENIQINGVVFGFLGVFIVGVYTLVRRLQRNQNHRNEQAARAFYAQTYAPSPYAPAPVPVASVPAPDAEHTNIVRFLNHFTGVMPADIASALLLAFIAYLVGHFGFALLFRYALQPFSARMDALQASQLLRLNFVLELMLYVPVFLAPLWTLRTRIASNRSASRILSLRTLMTHLGYRTRNVFAEIRAALSTYLLLMPGLVLAGLISHVLFHRFHTPVNPAQFETMAAQQMPDKILIFLLAAVVAPIVEETMFRGLLYSALRERFGIGGAAMLSAAIFSLVHPTLPGGFLTIWAIGIALALVYERRGSLVPGMILHGVHNGLITLLGFAVFGS